MTQMCNSLSPGGIHANLSPDAFHRWAEHFYKAKCDFRSPHNFSPVPYFLCCRTLELEIKAKHLQEKPQEVIKRKFGHDLVTAYDALSEKHKILSKNEYAILKQVNEIYSTKGFEYINLEDALSGYKRFPDLNELDRLTRKILQYQT